MKLHFWPPVLIAQFRVRERWRRRQIIEFHDRFPAGSRLLIGNFRFLVFIDRRRWGLRCPAHAKSCFTSDFRRNIQNFILTISPGPDGRHRLCSLQLRFGSRGCALHLQLLHIGLVIFLIRIVPIKHLSAFVTQINALTHESKENHLNLEWQLQRHVHFLKLESFVEFRLQSLQHHTRLVNSA